MSDSKALTIVLAEEALERAGEAPEPTAEELLDYLAGRLPPAAEKALQRQLVAHPELAEKLLDLEAFAEAGEKAGGGPSDLATHAGWRDFEARRTADGAPSRRPPLWLSALAASLLVATLGLGFRVWELERQQGRPIANLRSLELAAGSRAGVEPTVELEPGAPFQLVLEPGARCPAYEAMIAGPGSGESRTVSGLARDDRGLLTLLLPGAPGTYRLTLYGCEPRRELVSHRFQVVRPSRAGPEGDGG